MFLTVTVLIPDRLLLRDLSRISSSDAVNFNITCTLRQWFTRVDFVSIGCRWEQKVTRVLTY